MEGLNESGLLKLNCDKALHHLRWRAAWDFDVTSTRNSFALPPTPPMPSQSIADFFFRPNSGGMS
jgi:hypothetical protein